jgi:alpha-galactosidase
LGLKLGIYTSVGTTNCSGTGAGSWGHYQRDADTFASWGVDYVKVDWCAVPLDQFPGMTQEQVAQKLYGEFQQALKSAGRPMLYSLSTNRPSLAAWTWAPSVGNCWRTTNDISDSYTSVLDNFELNVQHSSAAGPGGWNDPDMLEVGNGGLTQTEERTQFSLWAEMAAPLIAGNDLATMSEGTQDVLTNPGVISVDQDSLGRQGHTVAHANGHWVLTKPLANGDRAVVLFNSTDQPAVLSTTAADVGLPAASGYTITHLWRNLTTETSGAIDATVPARAVAMLRVSAIS